MSIIALFTSIFGINTNGGENNNNDAPTEPVIVAEPFVSDFAYGSAERETMDIAFPEGAKGDVDLIIFIHGGAWTSGSKDEYTDQIKTIADNGYIGVAMNYSYISKDIHCDTILNEITMALKAVRSKAAERGINVSRYIIAGYSAGGQLAPLYAYSRGSESGLSPAAVVDLAGPTALEYVTYLKELTTVINIGDTDYVCELLSYLCGVTITLNNLNNAEVKAALQSVSATHYTDTAVSTIIAHGEKDNTSPIASSVLLSAQLKSKGVRCDFVRFPNSGHGLDSDPSSYAETEALLAQYASDYLSSYKK